MARFLEPDLIRERGEERRRVRLEVKRADPALYSADTQRALARMIHEGA